VLPTLLEPVILVSQSPVSPSPRNYTSAVVLRLMLMSVCLMALVIGVSFLPEGNPRARASGHKESAGEERASPVLLTTPAQEKGKRSPDGLWQESNEKESVRSQAEIGIVPKSYRRLRLDQKAQAELLRHAPMEFTKAAEQATLIMTLPMPNGTFSRFRIEESPIMEPELAARFPEIKTYKGKGIDDPTATMRFDRTPTGLHAIVLSSQGTIFIEPHTKENTSTYISYFKRDWPEDAQSFQCSTAEAEEPVTLAQIGQTKALQPMTKMIVSGTTLRTYRLAVAATAEYTQIYGGGTVSGGLAAVTTTINLVNAVFERDVAIRLVLVAGQDSIIFTDTATDGYTHNSADTLLNENQARLDSIIGSGNYDIGHVLDGQNFRPSNLFYFQGRGNGRACINGQKAKGVSILRLLEPATTTAVWELLHEMGHQFGASHTFNGTTANCSSARVASTAYEPGTGSTIMGYRGTVATGMPYLELCADEDLRSTDLYFHNASIEQIVNYTTTGGASSCAAQIETGNNSPMVSAGPGYTIPQSTPFALTAAGSDQDADALTYCWEQFDLGTAAPPNTDNGNRPIFRSFAPTPNGTRLFPQLADILSGTATFGESLPVTNRTMNFRVTVRDNHSGGGAVNTGATQVNVYSGSGPFTVTQPSSSTTWAAGSTQTVTWDVANTSNAPVNCANVRILLSTDEGNTFPITLLSSTPNNGAAQITVPHISTTTARVKVEALGNIFFNISRPNFTISASNSATPPVLLTEESTNRAIALDSVTFMRDPFPLATAYNFSADHRTRLTLFAVNLELMAGEEASVVTAQAEDGGHNFYPLQVEYVGKVPNFDWLTQVVIKLPDAIASSSEVWISIHLRGVASNKVLVSIK
jgi:hypothetical protein